MEGTSHEAVACNVSIVWQYDNPRSVTRVLSTWILHHVSSRCCCIFIPWMMHRSACLPLSLPASHPGGPCTYFCCVGVAALHPLTLASHPHTCLTLLPSIHPSLHAA
jgi:hypothetical protein